MGLISIFYQNLQCCSSTLDLFNNKIRKNFRPYGEELAVGDDADEADAVGVAVEGRGGDAVDLAEASEEEGKTNGRHLEIFALKIMN